MRKFSRLKKASYTVLDSFFDFAQNLGATEKSGGSDSVDVAFRMGEYLIYISVFDFGYTEESNTYTISLMNTTTMGQDKRDDLSKEEIYDNLTRVSKVIKKASFNGADFGMPDILDDQFSIESVNGEGNLWQVLDKYNGYKPLFLGTAEECEYWAKQNA